MTLGGEGLFSPSVSRVVGFTRLSPPAGRRCLLSSVLVVAIAAVVLPTLVAAATTGSRAGWRLVDLGTLGGKVAYSSEAVAINARGEVIGNSRNNSWSGSNPLTRAFLWRGGKLIALGTLGGPSSQANAINDRGQIVGWAETRSGKTHAFLWENGHMRDLGVPPGTDSSEAVAITNTGLVAGVANRSGHVVVWQYGRIRDLGRPWSPSREAGTLVEALNERGQIVGSTGYEYLSANGRVSIDRSFLWDGRNLRVLPPRNARSEALDINESGQIIGWTYRGEFRAVTWERGTMRLLPLPPGGRGAFTSGNALGEAGHAINDRGEIVGSSWSDREVDDHAVLWRNRTVLDLGTLGGNRSAAVAINNRGQVVGSSFTAGGTSDEPIQHAFLWQNGSMTDLGAPATENSEAVAINERGQIIGNGIRVLRTHALVWLPTQ